jgi:hypothetical protein
MRTPVVIALALAPAMVNWAAILGALVGSGIPSAAAQAPKTITECERSSGWSYYLAGAITGNAGWQRDGGDRDIRLVTNPSGNEPEILTRDITGRWTKFTPSKPAVIREIDRDRIYFFVVDGYEIVETYLFKVRPDGSGSVALTQTRANENGSRVSAFVADCHKPPPQ